MNYFLAILKILLYCGLFFGTEAIQASPQTLKPVYIIAHRINDTDDIEKALDQGANALELDVRWGRVFLFSKRQWYVDHDGVYFWSNTLNNWFKGYQRLQRDKPDLFEKLALVIFDIKTPEQLIRLRNEVRQVLPKKNVIYSVNSYEDRDKLIILKNDLKNNEGLAIDYKADPIDVRNFFVEKGVHNFWYGDGVCAGCYEPPRVSRNIIKAVDQRNKEHGIKGVYAWTYAACDSIYHYIQERDVDGIMVNIADNAETLGNGLIHAIKIITADSTRRLANQLDDAFNLPYLSRSNIMVDKKKVCSHKNDS
jgi:glycerophosphoryl diester phosphodiesterase